MSELSVDILGYINLLPHRGAKKPQKYYPVVYADINFGCIVTDIVDSYNTGSMRTSLEKLQANYSEINFL